MLSVYHESTFQDRGTGARAEEVGKFREEGLPGKMRKPGPLILDLR
jgi:hypothetical protein